MFYEYIDYTLAFEEKQSLPQHNCGPRFVKLILTESHDFFKKLKSRFQTQINLFIWSSGPVYLGLCIPND